MARTLCLLVCISAAMTATGGYKYPNDYDTWHPHYVIENSETIDYLTHDRMNARSSELSSEEMVRINERSRMKDSDQSNGGSYKIMNRGTKPTAMSRRRAGNTGDKVLFPGPTSRTKAPIDERIPEDCRKHKLCDNVLDYPIELATMIIADLGESIKYLSMEKLEEPEITQRVGINDEHLDFCESQSKIIEPTGGLDRNGTYHDILNNPSNPVQRFRVEICNVTDSPCKSFVCVERHYEARCVQKYTYRKMMVIDKKTNSGKLEDINVPSCCACVAKTTIV